MAQDSNLRRENAGAREDGAVLSLPPDDAAADTPKKPKDYEVCITFTVRKKDENEELQEFFSTDLTYPNATYALVVIMQQKMLRFDRMLGNMGIMMAHQKGFGNELAQFGIELSEDV